jgi:hypothetical protein
MRAMLLISVTFTAVASHGAYASGGAYASLQARDAAACARLCADDGLCMAWSFQSGNTCELRATAPRTPAGLAYGLSRRAPDELRQAIPEAAPDVVASGPTPPQSARAAPPQERTPTTGMDDELDRVLLGGFVEDGTGLRN